MRFAPVLLLALLALAACSGPAPLTQDYDVTAVSTSEAGAAASMISAYRTAHGLSPVTVDPRLNRAAEHQARAVAGAGRLSHGDFAGRMNAYGIRGYSAENLTAGSPTVEGAIARWKASPAHNSNLLLTQARHVGLARADAKGGYGRYWALVLAQ
jgi:uncharacterized protein YkwD